MPLHIIRQDITKMECDAIVNAANKSLLGGGGVDGAIHKAAGKSLLEECKTLGGCETGEAKITGGYNLPSKYVIHTVGPVWHGGTNGEREKLISCYKNSLELAKKYGCETVAFPLISAGVYGYPKLEAFTVATDTISKFLEENEMTVYVVVFDKDAFRTCGTLYDDIEEYIDDNYATRYARRCNFSGHYRRISADDLDVFDANIPKRVAMVIEEKAQAPQSLIEMLDNMDDSFAVMLLKLIDLKGMDDVECYKKANVSKQTWYKILNDKEYRPSKNTILAFAIALRLNYEETQRLLSTAGFALSKSNRFDIIIEYFLAKGEYDIFKINKTLFDFDLVGLG